MTIRILAFARIREIAGFAQGELTMSRGARVADAWEALVSRTPALAPFRASTRIARNGHLADGGEPLSDGDEIALLPPSGGG